MDKTVNITNFIGVYDNYITQEECNKAIQLYEQENEFNHTINRIGFENEPRAFVFSIYLNDVKEGGETEFLHFSKRVQPKAGRIVIWPAGFPYLHRGNPPLSGEKYILTSWMLLR